VRIRRARHVENSVIRASFSGEHGDGQSKAEFLPKLFGPELIQAFAECKQIFDPDWKKNPGKLIHLYRMDENLRFSRQHCVSGT
jgi:FAD/FMN-containing dehydrogenase